MSEKMEGQSNSAMHETTSMPYLLTDVGRVLDRAPKLVARRRADRRVLLELGRWG